MVTVGLAFISALVGWSGTAALAAYAQRRPCASAVAWLIAALGMTVGLSAAVIGALFDFGPATFRLLHIGISLLGPLYAAWGALEFALRSPGGKFTARLLLSALTAVPLVVFSMDRLSGQFGSSLPAFSDHYDLIPRALAGGVQGLAGIFLLVAFFAVARRRSASRGIDLAVVGLVALTALTSVVVGRFGLEAFGPLLMLVAVSALWGAGSLAVSPRRDVHEDDYDDGGGSYYEDDYYDDEDYYGDEDYYDETEERSESGGYEKPREEEAPPKEEPAKEPKPEPVQRRRRDSAPHDEPYGASPGRGQGSQARSVITIYTIADGQVQAFDRLANTMVAEVSRNEPDTLLFASHTVSGAQQQRIVYAIYRDRLAREEHEQQPHVMEFQQRSANVVAATNVIELSLSEAAAAEGLAARIMPR